MVLFWVCFIHHRVSVCFGRYQGEARNDDVLMAKNWSKLQRRARHQWEWAAGGTGPSLQRHRAALVRAAELLSELENVLCPIASTSLFHFQAVRRAEATISSISHLAYSKLEWAGFSLAYKWATGSSMSSRWDCRLGIRKGLTLE